MRTANSQTEEKSLVCVRDDLCSVAHRVVDFLARCVNCYVHWSSECIPFNGIPYLIVGRLQMPCRHGPRRKRKTSRVCVFFSPRCTRKHRGSSGMELACILIPGACCTA